LPTIPRTPLNSNTVFSFNSNLFSLRKWLINHSLRTIPPNNLKSSQCTLLIKSFLKIPKSTAQNVWFERSQLNKT
jgi:hypothetical protein